MAMTREQAGERAEILRKLVKPEYKPWGEEIADDVRGRFDAWTLADIPCGPGLLAFEIAFASENLSTVHLVDESDAMLQIAETEVKKAKVLVETHQGSLGASGLPDQSVQVISCKHALHTTENMEKSLATLFSMLAPDGRLYLIDYDSEGSKFAAKKWSWTVKLKAGSVPAQEIINGFESAHARSKTANTMKKIGFVSVKTESRGANFFISASKPK